MVSMANTVVGVFEEYAQAQEARQDLIGAGFRELDVRISEREAEASQTREESYEHTSSFWDNVRDFFGIDDTDYYEEASRRGGGVLTVSASEDRLDDAVNIMQKHHPIDVDRKAEQWRKSGWTPRSQTTGKAPSPKRSHTEQERIPVAEEKMKIGKRREQRGGVRIYTHTSEKPVEEDVHLREEQVNVQRRSADRPADESAFKEQTIEAHSTREEPVVKKEARVTEEVVVDKDVSERTEKVRDTLRKTDVDVENTEGTNKPRKTAGPNDPNKPGSRNPRR